MFVSLTKFRAVGLAVVLLSSAAAAQVQHAQPDSQMQAVLDAMKALDAKPLHTLSVPDARTQVSAADAARTVQRDKISPLPEAKVATRDIAIPNAAGALPARVYIPEGKGPFPVVLYFHGGGWEAAGVAVNLINFDGVTHEFFGMAKVVDKAKAAVDAANADLVKAFVKSK